MSGAGIGNIYLAGLMGSGKSSLGPLLAQRMGRRFIDLDEAICAEAGHSLHDLVAAEGWLDFRMREYDLVKRCAGHDDLVLAFGGGTPRYAWNMDQLADSGIIVLLTADLKVLAARAGGKERPRVNADLSQAQDLARIWSEHKDSYLAAADILYPTDAGKSLEVEAAEILAAIDAFAARKC
ncbi:MAG: shikimate kinase [Alphaproteobacteria bacterium]|jgi:shikimate kinase|nr:shikimate kinase [Rhodospirillaceae bacterium]MDP6020664.1 shikimate kinase [Alphaproteobacteria bacterium]MDP6256614.1 shikimate kinase [Alphaproteobacteria bacterium]MDP7054721.1 shikimate kinase [Alphaproteobacteria bacterium]MDP7229633.1 shikimate kinase [Alphaproteobacteria bacterium]|tara:strand:- start:4784 stop:5326 length:543 start_codon:yes stop_codon:yes gene_type:complete